MADSQRKTANLFDGVIEQGSYNTSVTPISKIEIQQRCRTSSFIDVSENLNYTASLLSANDDIQCVIYFLNGSKGKISEVGWSTAPISFTTPNGCQYITLIFKNTAGTPISPVNCGLLMVNEGSTPLPYEPYGWLHSLRKLTTATEAVENPLYSDGTAITSYTIKGNTVQNGTPTPSNPVEVNGVGVRTENLTTLYNPNTSSSGGLNFEAIGDKLRIYGTASTYVQCINTNDIILPSGTYTFSISSSIGNTGFYAQFRSIDGTTTYATITNTTTITFNEATTGRIRVIISATESKPYATDEVISIMINEGSTAKPYEPYGYKIPISSGGVTTNIYLGSTQTVRLIKKVVFDGTENWEGTDDTASKYLRFYIYDYKLESGVTCMSTHYSGTNNIVSGDIMPNNSACFYNAENPRILYLKGSGPITLADFKAYLAQQYANGTPVTLWYVVSTPETVTVNEPLMKIGTYADTLSNAASIPTTEGANSITVDTTVQPSEFTATWTGWHDASVKEKSENYLDENDFGLVEVAAGTYRVGTDVGVLPSGKYTFNAVKSSSAVQIYRTTKNGSTYNYEAISELPYTFTADGVSNQIFRTAGSTETSWADAGYSNVMLNMGETAQTYEPYWK